VFDAAMLVALPWIGREELVAALVVFRLLYFMVPFALALATMACWEVALMFRKERKGG
jgi:glycosyltransferase 2 family protein